ncbi:MAG: hypothetical protein QXG76_01365 [Candidatus Bathyarchaeia archaeon]
MEKADSAKATNNLRKTRRYTNTLNGGWENWIIKNRNKPNRSEIIRLDFLQLSLCGGIGIYQTTAQIKRNMNRFTAYTNLIGVCVCLKGFAIFCPYVLKVHIRGKTLNTPLKALNAKGALNYFDGC